MPGRSRSRSRSPRGNDRNAGRERDRRDERDRDQNRERERERDSHRGDRVPSERDRRDNREPGRGGFPPARMESRAGADMRGDPRRPSATALKPMEPIDREKTCPLLLRMFCKTGGHHREEEFGNGRIPRDDELITHTWLDASLKELAALIREVWPDARLKGTRLEFSLVYPMPTGQIAMKLLGSTIIGRRSNDDMVALGQTRFKIGDYIDVAVHPYDRTAGGRDF